MSIPFSRSSFPEIYERLLVGPLFRPWAELLIDEVAPAPGERVLDVACGTGIVARLAAERVGADGTVVGVDLSAPMLAVAGGVAPTIDWREGDAGSLPVGRDERFDVVVCQQGLQFFADRAAAVAEMHRVLDDGGRLAVSTWRPDAELPVGLELRRRAERHVGPVADRRHSFGEPEPVEALLRDAGFRDIRSRTRTCAMRFDDGATFVRLNAVALVGMSAGGAELTDGDREHLVEAIVRDSADVIDTHTGPHGFQFELRANVTTARRSGA